MDRAPKKQKKPKLLLASGSPRRRALLNPYFQLQIWVPKIDESPKRHEQPKLYVKRIAIEKWMACKKNFKDQLHEVALTADTIVSMNNKIYGKPKNKNAAKKMILEFSGKTHEVITAFSVGLLKNKSPKVQLIVSKVKFREITEVELKKYLQKNEWKDKAGAYGIQGAASIFVDTIHGSLTNIIGLPVSEVLRTTLHA